MSYYKCWDCGEEVYQEDEPTDRVFCDECKQKHSKTYKEKVSEYVKLKIDLMYEHALRHMETAGMYLYEYQEAAEEVYQAARNDTESFYSSDEMVVAIVLKEFGYETYPNYSIGKYRVDFYIPELKICLEVDGHLHKGQENHDSNRDIDIRNILGKEWEVIRLPTKYIEKNPLLIPDAIDALLEEKKKIRKQNGGILPEWYSPREKKHYGEIGEYKTIRRKKM